MRNLNQFIIYELKPKANGKTDKIPLDYRTMKPCNAHSPAVWMSFEMATGYVATLGKQYGVGFVFTPNDQYLFLDIDDCISPDDAWSQVALDLYDMLPGALWERSQSGRGLHAFASYRGDAPEHGCKNIPLGLELYTQDRFVALTMNWYDGGNAGVDCTQALQNVIAKYFPPAASHEDVEWRDTPMENYSGPEDDATLLNKFLLSTPKISAAEAFGGGEASLRNRDLWENNVEALARAFPAVGEGPYDRSGADLSLAQRLAWWTGNNHERILRLMWQSALVRDKWKKHKKYLGMTVSRAVGRQDTWMSKQPTEIPESVQPEPALRAEPSYTTGRQYVGGSQLADHFEGCVYVQDRHRMFTPGGIMLKPEQFKATYGGYEFAMDADGSKSTRNAYEAFTDCQAVHFPKVNSSCFRPSLGEGAIVHEENRSMINVYSPVTIIKKIGDVNPFLHHMKLLFPNERDFEIIMAYLASVVQNPGVKFQWCPIIQGGEGNGKSFIGRALTYAVGSRYTHLPSASELGDGGFRFNGWILEKLLVIIEEIFTSDKREITEPMKILITNARIEIQSKGADQFTGDNMANFLMMTNHKDAMSLSPDSRRYSMFFNAQQTAQDILRDMGGSQYFVDLYNWANQDGYAFIAKWFEDYAIPDEFNPASHCQRAPHTSSTEESVHLSLGSVEHAVLDAVEEGRPGFRGGWISSKAFELLLREIGSERRIPINKRKALLESLGYAYHPGLDKGRCNSIVPSEGVKSKLYIKQGSILQNIQGPQVIQSRYQEDQGYVGGFGLDNVTSNS